MNMMFLNLPGKKKALPGQPQITAKKSLEFRIQFPGTMQHIFGVIKEW